MPDGDVFVHDALSFGHRQQIPVPGLHERVDKEEWLLSRHDARPPPFLSFVHVFGDILRMLGHRKIGVRDVEISAQERLVDVGSHLLERLEVIADAPQHEVDGRFQSERGVGEKDHPSFVTLQQFSELALCLAFELCTLAPQGAICFEEHEIDELTPDRCVRLARGLGFDFRDGHGAILRRAPRAARAVPS